MTNNSWTAVMPLQYENKKGCQLCHLVLLIFFCWKSHHRLARQSHYFLSHLLHINSCNVPGSGNSVSPKILYLPWNFLFDDDCKIMYHITTFCEHLFVLSWKMSVFHIHFLELKVWNFNLTSQPSSAMFNLYNSYLGNEMPMKLFCWGLW